MSKAILVLSGSAFLLGLAYALSAWVIWRKSARPRRLALVAAGLVVLHHAIAGVIVFYGKTVMLQLLLFRTIMVPWTYGFGYGPAAYWSVLAVQALAAALIAAGLGAALASKPNE